MAVMMPREKWTDERLDDLQAEMREGFVRVEEEVKRLDGNIERLDEDIKRIDRNLSELGREINIRFEGLQRNLQAAMVAVIVALISSNAF
jgi:predicted  nucleic acid-binding Zn-ribbon protein